MCTEDQRCPHCPGLPIGAGARLVAETLPLLGIVVAATANEAAVLSHTGQYRPVAMPGDALHSGSTQIALRLNPGLVGRTFLTPQALTLSDRTGTHRAYLTPRSDPLAVGALQMAPAEPPEHVASTDWTANSWNDADQITHLDALSADRYRVLPFSGAWRVEPDRVLHTLRHLSDIGVPLTVAVPGGGCVQLYRGVGSLVQQNPRYVTMDFGAAKYALDPAAVAECWVTRVHSASGITSALELYDHGGRCGSVLTQTGAVDHSVRRVWEVLAASLPELRP